MPSTDGIALTRWGVPPGQVLTDFIGDLAIHIGPANKKGISVIFFYQD